MTRARLLLKYGQLKIKLKAIQHLKPPVRTVLPPGKHNRVSVYALSPLTQTSLFARKKIQITTKIQN